MDFSAFQLLAAPALALAAAAVAARDMPQMEWAGISDVHSLAAKFVAFTVVYGLLLLTLEWRRLLRVAAQLVKSRAQ